MQGGADRESGQPVDGHTLLVHPDVDDWVRQRPDLRRRVDWLLCELTTRGDAGRAKGIVGPAARVGGVPSARWRRSGVGGFHYYAWWFPTDDWGAAITPAAKSVVVRAIRHHDEMRPLAAGDVGEYVPRGFGDLRPLTEEQARVVGSAARIRLVIGHPGTGKTGALLFAAVQEARKLPPGAWLLYVTLSRRLAAQAEEFLAGAEHAAGDDVPSRVRVVPLADLLADWSDDGGRAQGEGRKTELPHGPSPFVVRPAPSGHGAASDDDEERAFLSFVAGFAPRDLVVWQGSSRALWAEVRAHILGSALPFRLRDLPASREPLLDERSYRQIRERLIGGKAARAAWRAARLFVDRRDLPSVQREAWTALKRLRDGTLDRRLAGLAGLVVDEIQDLTLVQIAALAEAARRAGDEATAGSREGPLFVAAGDESQIVHPSGFDWGWCKDLLSERLGVLPEEVSLHTNQRSAVPLIEATNRTSLLYDELPKEYRPRGSAQAEKSDAPNGEVILATAPAPWAGDGEGAASSKHVDGDLLSWLGLLADTPHNAVVVPRTDPRSLAPAIGDERFADLLFTPSQVKGLDRQYVVIWDASQTLTALREEIEGAYGRGQQPRFLVARTAIDELRVAVSRATETLVFLDAAGVEPDPLLVSLVEDGSARRRSIAFLRDRLEERNADPRERALGFLGDAAELIESDLDRALRTLVRVDAALAELVDPTQRRDPLERAVQVRQAAAEACLRESRYAEAAEQLEHLAPISRELGAAGQAERYAVLARRYREAPPVAEGTAASLPALIGAYVDALEALPADQRGDDPYTLPRAWIEEAGDGCFPAEDRDGEAGIEARPAAGTRPAVAALRTLLRGASRLARLSGADEDRRAVGTLGTALADALLAAGDWAGALALLADQADSPPEKLARCHEGLGAWRRAAEARLAAGQPAEALGDYRRAGAYAEAAELAARLDRGDLAEVLGILASLTAALDRLPANLDAIAEGEAITLARRLRDAADLVTRRRQRR